jgi:isopenicillin N synthase-like dioxygenase
MTDRSVGPAGTSPAPAPVVPSIDLTGFRAGDPEATASLAREVDRANREVGFLVVAGHGVPADLVSRMDAVTRAFFDLPAADKLAVRCEVPAESRGYMPAGSRALARSLGEDTPPDLVEYFSVGRPDVPAGDPYFEPANAGVNFRPNRWPALPPDFREIWTAYYRELERLAGELMQVFALALGLERTWFDDRIDKHISNLFANHYPPMTTPPAPGQLRLGAHTDYGSLTLLYQDGTPGGLQVFREGSWQDAPVVPGTFVVNIGDLMQRWTNDRWVSTLHRVQNPADGRHDTSRLSIPFFCQPNYDALIEAIPTCVGPDHPARYEPITSGENMAAKTQATLY